MRKPLITTSVAVVSILVVIAFFIHERGEQSVWDTIKNPETVETLKQFVAMKEAQANVSTNPIPSGIQAMFKDANHGDWLALSNSFAKLDERIRYWNSLGYGTRHWHGLQGAVEDFISDAAGKIGSPLPWNYWAPPRLQGIPGEAIKEIYGAFNGFVTGGKYSAQFGHEVISSIPSGSIYFGGTDPGRFIVTMMEKSQVNADPFYTLTQNALADNSYLGYLRSMYGGSIYIPTSEDSQKCFQDYVQDARLRSGEGKLKPGENVKIDQPSGRIQISGHVAVMEINGLLVKTIFDKNPDREFYIEQSFPLDWMYPYLEPHGLIFKLNRQPLPELSDEIVQRDHDYWTKMIQPMIGDWLSDDTSVEEITTFAAKVFLRHDFSGFTGDPQFVQNGYSCKMFSKERNSIAGLYVWRMKNAAGSAAKERMAREADFAFRQAWALCPYSPEVVTAYVALLMDENRRADALLVAETAAKMPEIKGRDGDAIRDLVRVLQTTSAGK